MENFAEPNGEWWAALTATTRAALVSDPHGPVPIDAVAELLTLNTPMISAAFGDGPAPFALPDRFQDYIAQQKRASGHDDAP